MNKTYISPSSNAFNIVNEYFRVWKSYDLEGLKRIFDYEAKYEIIPKKRTLMGHTGICEYWNRNLQRQQDLILSWNVIFSNNSYVKTNFIAEFFDIEEKEVQRIEGQIEFFINEDNVSFLSENYVKFILDEYNGKS